MIARSALFFLVPVTLIAGCSQQLTTWQLNSPMQVYSPSQALCRYQGKRIAIVPGNAFSGRAKDSQHSFHTTTALNYATVSSQGELSYQVDGGPWIPIPGGTTLDPTAAAMWGAIFEKMGFTIVDRSHVTAVLDEQDVKAVYSANASQVGRLVGADVLAAISVHQTPSVYFVSVSGGYATQPTISQAYMVTFIAVADGSNLGSISGLQELWSSCGFARLEARMVSDGAITRVGYWVCTKEGTCSPSSQVDSTRLLSDANSEEERSLLEKWRKLCNEGG